MDDFGIKLIALSDMDNSLCYFIYICQYVLYCTPKYKTSKCYLFASQDYE